MISSPSTDSDLCTKFRVMAVETRSLMHLPAEVRLIIYKHLFSNTEKIALNINDSGYIALTRTAKLNLASLRVSKAFYIEACPVVYGINTFAVVFQDVHRLAKLRQRSRLCIENLTVEAAEKFLPNHTGQPAAVQSVALHAPNTGILTARQRNSPPATVLDLASIGTGLGGLQNLVVNTSTASIFLATVLQLSKNLPCSPIRAWPVLEVVVDIKTRVTDNHALDQALSLTDEHRRLISVNRRLSALSDTSNLGLGHEMPDLKTIRVNGTLTWDLCQLIEEHRSSFGDCSFEKQIIHNSMAEGHQDSKYRYTWCRIDEDEQHAKAKNATVNMHQWVPRLKREDYFKVLAAFGGDLETVQYSWPQV
jgi:hypothetical protein